MSKEPRVRAKKQQPLKNHVQTSINDYEYNALKGLIMAKGESKAIRDVIQFALNNGFLRELK